MEGDRSSSDVDIDPRNPAIIGKNSPQALLAGRAVKILDPEAV
jgi:hypothetical protein